MPRKPKADNNNPLEPKMPEGFASGATDLVPEIQDTPLDPVKPEPTDDEKKKARAEYQRQYRAKQKTGQAKPIPSQVATPDSPRLQLPSELLASLWHTIFSITAKIRSWAGYQITSEEAKILTEATIPVIEKYEAQWAGEYAAEIGLGLAVVSVATPRVIADLDNRAQGRGKNNVVSTASESNNGTTQPPTS